MAFKCKFIKIFGISLLSLILAHSVYAEIASIAVAPVTKSIVLSKGEAQSGTYVVYNNTDEVQHVNVEPRYWHMVDENKDIPLESWLKIVPLEFDIEPKEKKEVAFSVAIPQEAIGELAAMIAFRPEPKEEQAINIVFSVSLYVRIKDTEVIRADISDFKIWKFEDRDALGIAVVLKNVGNVHLKPRTTVSIQNIFNKTLQKADLKYGQPTYPGRVQDYQGAIYNFKLKPGLYKAMIDGEYTNLPRRFRKNIYFFAGRNGEIIFTFFRRPMI